MRVQNKYKFFVVFVGVAFCLFFLLPKTALAQSITSQEIFQLVNNERTENNLPPLAVNYKLENIAWQRANDMITKNYFSHQSPEGLMPWDFAEKENYDYEYLGENLAVNWLTAEETVDAWMQSATHRENILNLNFNETGVVVAIKENNYLITQLFGKGKTTLNAINTNQDQVLTVDSKAASAEISAPATVIENELQSIPSIIPKSLLMENATSHLLLDINSFISLSLNYWEDDQTLQKTLGVNTISRCDSTQNNSANYLHLFIAICYFPLAISLHLHTAPQNVHY